MKKLGGILVVLVASAIFSLNTFGDSEEVKKEQKKVKCPGRVKVQVEKIKEVNFKEYKNFSATFNAETEVVASTVSGTITDIRVYKDDLISKDWVIAVINNALKDEIENAEKEIKKWDTILFKRTHWKVRSEKDEKQAEEKINEAKLKLEEIKSKISDYIIKAPIEGKIKSLEISKDTEVSEASIIAKIVNDKKMLAYITITESDKTMFSEGQKIPFKITGVEDVLYAEVTKVYEDKIFLLINNQDKIIQEGLNVTLHVLKKEHKNVIVLPTKDIFTDKEGAFVFIVSEKRAKKVYLKTGPEEKGKILILEGLSAGDEMIISEILSSKEGILKEKFECLKDNVKIKIMVKDLKTGKFVKRKLKKEVKKEEVKKLKPVKIEKKVVIEKKVKEEKIEKPVEKPVHKKIIEVKKVKCPGRVKVQVKKIKDVNFKEYKNFSATFNAEIEVVTSTVSGTITDIRVYEDDLISKDWIIAVINNALKDEIENAEKEIKKWDTILFKRTHWKVRSEKDEKQAEEKINEAKLKLEEIKSKISDYIIKAPIEGKIKSLEISKDTEVSEASIIAKIVNDKKMLAYITITESDKTMFSEGQKIPFKITGVEDVLYAEVTKVYEDKIFLLINNQDKIIQEGLNVTLHVLKKEHKNVIVLPTKDIFTDKEGAFVFIVSEKRAKKVYLKTGPEEKGKILILEGLSAGDEMIISEILSSKEGILKEKFECLKDNVKIKIMVKDLKTGKFIKLKLKKEVKKEEIIEKPVEKRIRKNSLDLGVGFGYCSMVDGVFKEVYSSGLFSVLLNISYNMNYNYEIFLNIGYLNKKGIIEIVDEESTVTMMPIYIGGKYLFKTNSKIKPYIGIAGVIFRVKEENIYNPDASFENEFGLSLIGGVRLKISEKIDLFADMRYDFVKKSIENFDEKADLGGGKFHIGFVYKFSF